jgi:hypothetical protein
MSMPVPDEVLLVEPATVAALAAELSALAAELVGDAATCEVAAASLAVALGDDEGRRPRATATAWASLYRSIARQTAVLATSMTSAVAATVAHDSALAEHVEPQRADAGTGPR